MYDNCLDWFLGIKFNWLETEHALKCHVYQEAFILDTVEHYNLTDCNQSPRATPFRSGFHVDNVALSQLPPNEQSIILKKYQQIIGDLNWLSISTRPDKTTIVLLLPAHTKSPSQAHYDAAFTCHKVHGVNSIPWPLLDARYYLTLSRFFSFSKHRFILAGLL